jgi:hypothetical protein
LVTGGFLRGRPSTARFPSRTVSAAARRCSPGSERTRPFGRGPPGLWPACGRCTASSTGPVS